MFEDKDPSKNPWESSEADLKRAYEAPATTPSSFGAGGLLPTPPISASTTPEPGMVIQPTQPADYLPPLPAPAPVPEPTVEPVVETVSPAVPALTGRWLTHRKLLGITLVVALLAFAGYWYHQRQLANDQKIQAALLQAQIDQLNAKENFENLEVKDKLTAGQIETGALTVTGPTNLQAVTVGTFTATGQAVFTGTPTGSGVSQGSVYINPATAGANDTLLGAAVGGQQKFRLDGAGNIYANNVILTGSITGADTTVNNLSVLHNTTLGTSSSDTLTVNATSTFNAGVTIGGSLAAGATTLNSLTVTNATLLQGALTANGSATFNSNVSVAGSLNAGPTTLDSLTVTNATTLQGILTANGAATFNNTVNILGALTTSGTALFTHQPTQPHMFSPWPLGTSNFADATLYVNPAASVADGNLIAAAVGGVAKFVVDAEGDVFARNLVLTGSTSTGSTTVAGDFTVEGNTILGDAPTDTLTVNATSTFTAPVSITGTSTLTVGTGATTLGGNLAVNGGSITTTAATANLFNTNATTINFGGAATTLNVGPTGAAGNILLSGGSADTGCTLDGTTGNFTCSGNITGNSIGTVGYWTRVGTTLQPATAGDNVTTSGNLSTSGTGTITSAGLLTASNGLTLATGALNLTATSGALTVSGLSASSINAGANNLTVTAGNFNTTATGINSTAIGASTPSTGAFTTLSASSTVTLSGLAANSGTSLCLNGTTVVTCTTGSSAATLQSAYNAGNTITTTDGRNISITLADTATDQTVEITQAGTADAFRVNDDGTFSDTTPFVIDASGNVGIGTTGPTNKLSVAGNADFSGHLAVGTGATINQSFVDYAGVTHPTSSVATLSETITADPGANGYNNGAYTDLLVNPGAALSAVNIGSFANVHSQSGNGNSTMILDGVWGNATHSGTGVALLNGVTGYAYNTSIGSVPSAIGVRAAVTNRGVATMSNAYGIYASSPANTGGGTITNGYGMYIDFATNSGGGTFSRNYGLYIADESGVGSLSSYNLYSAGASSKNYFDGSVGIGDTTPAAALTVGNGDLFQVNSSGNITLNQTSPTISIGNTGTLTVNDGSNTLCQVVDAGTTGNLTCTGNITGASTGTVGYWSRSGTTLQPATAGDNVTTSGNISTSGSGTITSAGLLTASNGLTVSAGQVLLPDGSSSAPSLSFSSETNTGFRRFGTGAIGVQIQGTSTFELSGTTTGVFQAIDMTSGTGRNLTVRAGGLTTVADTGAGTLALGGQVGTGAGAGGTVIIRTPTTLGTGTTTQTAVDRLTVSQGAVTTDAWSLTVGANGTIVLPSSSVTSPAIQTAGTTQLILGAVGAGDTIVASNNVARFTFVGGTNTLQFGAGMVAAPNLRPTNQSGTDTAGRLAVYAGGAGTGAGTPGALTLATTTTLGSSATVQSQVARLTISGGAVTTDASTATWADALDFIFGTTTGTKIGTSTTQKLGFYGATPIVQPAGTTDLRQALINLGLYASGGATPLDLNGGSLTAASGTFSSNVAVNGGTLSTTAATAALFNSGATTLSIGGAATTLNIGPTGSGASSIVLSGGSADTGCTVNGATGDLTCSGNITGSSTGTAGFWSRSGTTLQPATAGDAVTTSGNISTSGSGTITSAGLLTASNGLTLTSGVLTLTGTNTIDLSAGSNNPIVITNNINTATINQGANPIINDNTTLTLTGGNVNSRNVTALRGNIVLGSASTGGFGGTGVLTGVEGRAVNNSTTLTVGEAHGVTAIVGSSAAGGTTTTAYGVETQFQNTGAITSGAGLHVQAPPGAGAITGLAGVAIDALTQGTNNTYLLLGTATIPTGSFAIYSTSTNSSQLAGSILFSTAGTSGSPNIGLTAKAGSNQAGLNFFEAGGTGTGTGAGGSWNIQTPTTLTTGSTAQTLVTRLTVSQGAVTTDAFNVTVATNGTLVSPIVNATTGFQLNGAAASGNYLRGNGTNFVSSALQSADGAGLFLRNVPAATSDNTVTPTVNSVIGLTVNGTSGTAATAVSIVQAGNATALNVAGSGTGNLGVFDTTNASANGVSIDVQSSSSSQYALQVTSNNGATKGLYVRADGNVGIGTTAPDTQLRIEGAGVAGFNEGANNQIVILSSQAYNTSPTAGILLANHYTSGGSAADMGGIFVGKENTTDGNIAGFLALATRAAGDDTHEKLRITSAGKVGIGTTGPDSTLHVIGGTCVETTDTGCAAANGTISAGVGFRVANAAASGNYLRGDGTNFVSSALQSADGAGLFLRNVPAATSDNTVTPTVNSVIGLTVNGTSGTSALVGKFLQSNATSTGDTVQIETLTASGTQTDLLDIVRASGGTTTNGIHISTSDSTITNAINIAQSSTGTITTGINFSGTFTTLIASTGFAVNNAGAITKANAITFSAASGTKTERVCQTGGGTGDGVALTNGTLGDCSATGQADIAEYYGTDGTVNAAEIVVPDISREATNTQTSVGASSKAYVKKSAQPYEATIIGAVSTNPATEVISDGVFSASENPKPIALAGRVPVKVNTENGPIAAGDYITSSSTPGVGMKAMQAGQVIGVALSSYSGAGVGSVIVFIHPNWYSPSTGNITQGSANFDTLTAASATITNLHVSGTAVVYNLVVNGHIVTGGQTPIATAGSAACGGTMIISGTDTAGTITITTGAGACAAGSLANIKFSTPYGAAPRVVISAGNSSASALQYYVNNATASTTAFDVSSNNAPAPATTYTYNYQVIQ